MTLIMQMIKDSVIASIRDSREKLRKLKIHEDIIFSRLVAIETTLAWKKNFSKFAQFGQPTPKC